VHLLCVEAGQAGQKELNWILLLLLLFLLMLLLQY